jgi:hypothetical protein
MPPTTIANVVQQTIDWTNLHGTFTTKNVTRFLPVASPSGNALERWRRVGSILQDVLKHAFDSGQPLRPDGSRWSLSNIGQPERLALSLAAHDVCEAVPAGWLTAPEAARLAGSQHSAMVVSGSMKIGRLNDQLSLRHLSLQTSGASNGQTLAGATATGTHGAALQIGALHDTIRAVHLVVAPDRALLLQPASQPFTPLTASDLTAWLGFPTELVTDDDAFNAARVHLGALGIVLNMIVEVAPLYYYDSVQTPLAQTDTRWNQVLHSLDPSVVPGHVTNPDHLDLVFNPFRPLPSDRPRLWLTSMRKRAFTGQPDVQTSSGAFSSPNPDLLGFIAHLADFFDSSVTTPVFRKRITDELTSRYGTAETRQKALHGVMFGPTSLPPGHGHSIEFALDAKRAEHAVDTVLLQLTKKLNEGEQFLGGIGVRFVKGSSALLAPNLAEKTCFIELPCVRTSETLGIFAACGKALDAAGIPFGCHWGQHNLNTKARLRAYWGNRGDRWKTARGRLLSSKAQTLFSSRILASSGLG